MMNMAGQEKVIYPSPQKQEKVVNSIESENILWAEAKEGEYQRSVHSDEPYVYLTGVITFD